MSSNGTKSDAREQREAAAAQKAASSTKQSQAGKGQGGKQQQQQLPHPKTTVLKKGLVMSTSSEYTTDSDDDSEWASEDGSVEAENEHDKKEKEQQKEKSRLLEAAEEAQRQRDMFAKVDRRSYTNLNRTRSGLLSQLLNPDPTIFPPDHPYRVKSLTDVTRFGRAGAPAASMLATSKSSAALPLTAQITPLTAQAQVLVESANTKGSTNGNANGNAYRPRGRPQGQEMESESEEEGGENGIQLSRSLAQQRLAALADPKRRRASDQSVRQHQQQQQQMQEMQQQQASTSRAVLPSIATAPIPLAHPYNLPAPAPPMTPRTTRRQMLSTELSESLRRNLLWERQVSKVNMLGGARRHGLLSNNLRPLTAVNGSQQGQQQQPADEREERRRAAIARNRSWADDYHTAGW